LGRFLDFEGVDAVLFDCDGVMVDSEPVSEWAWRTALSEYGIDLGPFSAWVGTTDEAIAVRFAPEAGVSPAVLADRAADLLLEGFAATPLEVFEDAMSALERALTADLGVAVVTNSEAWRLDAILESAGLGDHFAVRVTSDDVEHPKPDPDVYRRAAEILGVDPSRCLVIEDSPTGITSARAANMRVVVVDRGVFEQAALAAATRVVSSLDGAARSDSPRE
jgi:HAD superfamily hydrolase (TIGR01509 family)